MSEKRFKPYSVSTTDGDGFVIGIQNEDGTVMSIIDASEMLNEQQATISQLKEENEQLRKRIGAYENLLSNSYDGEEENLDGEFIGKYVIWEDELEELGKKYE